VLWWFATAVAVLVSLGLALAAWLIRSELRERRKARYFAGLAAQYRKKPPALPVAEPQSATEPSSPITVGELVARIKGEASPTSAEQTVPLDVSDEPSTPSG
jgi:hypothetical protein